MLDSIKKFLIKHQGIIISLAGSFSSLACHNLKYHYNLPIVHDIVVIVICTLGIILYIKNKDKKGDKVFRFFTAFVFMDFLYLIARLLKVIL
jgi:uncharacterized protein YacL